MTEQKNTSASETDDAKKKPYVPITDRPLLGVPEAEALTGCRPRSSAPRYATAC